MQFLTDETNLSWWQILLTVTISTFLYKLIYRSQNQKHDESPPALPPIASMSVFQVIKQLGKGEMLWIFSKLCEEVKSDVYRFRLPTLGTIYIIGSPKLYREILIDKGSDKPRKFYGRFDLIGGKTSMFGSSTNSKWKTVRKGIAHAFSYSEIARMNVICSNHVEKWIHNTLEPCIRKGASFDPSTEMCRITFGVLLEAAFEYPNVTKEEYRKYSRCLEASLKEYMRIRPFRKLYGPFVKEYQNAMESVKVIRALSKKILHAYELNPQKSQNKTVIRMIFENKAIASEEDRIAQITGLIIAGHDTTGFSLGNALIQLAKHPDVSEKLYTELSSMEKSERSKSQYLKCVLNESNRLTPVAGLGGIRQTNRDFIYKSQDSSTKMIIPKGSICYFPQLHVNRNKTMYPDPERFYPERWENVSPEMKDARFGFSVGHRNCVGQSLAVSEMHSVLSRLSSEYKFEIEAEGQLENFLTLKYLGARLKASTI